MKAYEITLKDYCAILELAVKNGKQPGDDMQEEFDTYFKNKSLKCIGDYPDKDMLMGNLREEGNFKILDLTKNKNEK